MALATNIDGSGRNIFYFWDRPETFPEAFSGNLRQTRKIARGWKVHFVDDVAVREVLRDDPDLLALYDRIRIPACRSDIARLVLLHRYGGWYLDADILVRRDLSRFGSDRLVLFRRDDPFAEKNGITGRVTNMAFHAPRGEAFTATALQAIRDNAARGRFLYSVRDFSGPVLFTRLAENTPLPEGTLQSFDASFNGPQAVFQTSVHGTSASWKLQQHFGVLEGLAPRPGGFPRQLNDRQAKVLTAFARSRGLEPAFLKLYDTRPAWRENALAREAVQDFRDSGHTVPAPARTEEKKPMRKPKANPEPTPAPRAFCIQGLFRSGTNFARALFELNYDCLAEYDSYGWKHGPYPARTPGSRIAFPDMPTLFVTKNPVHSLSSVFTYAVGGAPSIRSAAERGAAAFLREPIVILVGADPESPEFFYENPVALWNAVNWNYLSTVGKKAISLHVSYEDMVARPEAVVTGVADTFGFTRKSTDFEVPQKKVRNMRTNMHDPARFQTNQAFDSRTLGFDKYAEVFSREDLALIAGGVNPDLAARAGYATFLEELAGRL